MPAQGRTAKWLLLGIAVGLLASVLLSSWFLRLLIGGIFLFLGLMLGGC